MKYHSVYELIDTRDNLPFYVGCSVDPDFRFFQHLGEVGLNPAKTAKIDDILTAGLEPKLHIIEKWEDRRYAEERETHWIVEYLHRGIPLTNVYITPPTRKTQKPKPASQPKKMASPQPSPKEEAFLYDIMKEWVIYKASDTTNLPEIILFDLFCAVQHAYGSMNDEEEAMFKTWKAEQEKEIPVPAELN